MLLVGGMLLTGTSVSALARGIGRGLRAIFRGVFHGGDAAARTVARTHADWREQRETPRRGETQAGATDVMSSYPEDGRGFEPTVALPRSDEASTPAIFDAETEPKTRIAERRAERGPTTAQLRPRGRRRGRRRGRPRPRRA